MSPEQALSFAIRSLEWILLFTSVVSIPMEMLEGHPGGAVVFYVFALALLWRRRIR